MISTPDRFKFPTARVIPILYSIFKGGLVDPRLRASNEHILIVCVLRARRAPGHSLLFPPSLLVLSLGMGAD